MLRFTPPSKSPEVATKAWRKTRHTPRNVKSLHERSCGPSVAASLHSFLEHTITQTYTDFAFRRSLQAYGERFGTSTKATYNFTQQNRTLNTDWGRGYNLQRQINARRRRHKLGLIK